MIEKIIQKVGDFCSWLSFALVILITLDVFLRYVFNFSSASLYELEWHFFAIIFLLILLNLFFNKPEREDFKFDNNIASEINDFLLKSLCINPNNRYNSDQLLNDKWFIDKCE